MSKRENDGFFNLRALSFLSITIFFTVFSLAYADWHNARITGNVILSSEYQDFYDNYVSGYDLQSDYRESVEGCLLTIQTEEECDDYIDNCILELRGDIDPITIEIEETDNIQGCRFLFEEVISGRVLDPEAFVQFIKDYVDSYVITSSCQDYVTACDRDLTCNGLVLLCHQAGNLGQDTCQFFQNRCYVSETTSSGQVIQGSTKPPESVVEEVSKQAAFVKESSKYAEAVKEVISTKPLSESDLVRYKENLEAARKLAAEAYDSSYEVSSKYSSLVLSDYQQEIASNLASIEKNIRQVNSILTTTVEERFEKQAQQAVWELNRKGDVRNSFNSLESFSSSLISLGTDYSSPAVITRFPGEIGEGGSGEEPGEEPGESGTEFDLRLAYPGTINIPQGEFRQFDLRIYNDGLQPITNCRISALNYAGQTVNTGTWFSYIGFENSVFGFNSLGPGQNGIYQVTISPPSAEYYQLSGLYLINLRVACTQGQEDGFSLSINIENQAQGGQTGEIPQELLENLLGNYPYSQLNPSCQADLNDCNSFGGAFNTCGEISHFYDCAVNNLCDLFEEICIPGYIPQNLFDEFMVLYVNPYYNLPSQCVSDVYLCSQNPLNCPNYIYQCIMDGGCDEYLVQCINTATTQQGSSGGSGGGSSGGSSTGSQGGSSTGSSGGSSTGSTTGGINSPCQGDPLCEQLISTCLTPSYIIATDLNLVDFGGFGYNAVTGDICYMGNSNVYLTKPFSYKEIGTPGSSGGSGVQVGVDPEEIENKVVSIHFQNSQDSSNRNYVAAVVYSLNGHLTLNFFNSPDYDDLEDRLREFIQNLLYGEEGGSYITGMSLQQAEEIVSQSASVPWVLWIILFVMVVCFVFFGNLLSPYNDRLISSGKKALNKKDYSLAIQNYNELASLYAVDSRVKQDALEYLRQIKEKVGGDKISLEFAGSNELPKIKTNHSFGILGDYSRVQKMISHALEDLKKSPKLVKSRMPTISQEYKRLSPRDKERLASSYESLIYKLRNL